MSDAPDTKLAAFRAEARAWLEANFPSSLKGRGNVGGEAPVTWEGDAALWK